MRNLTRSLAFRADARRRRAGAAVAQAVGLAVLLAIPPRASAAGSDVPAEREILPALAAAVRQPGWVDFTQASRSPEVEHVAHWVAHSSDNAGMPYMIVDKVNARVFVFDAFHRLQGAEPALLGAMRGDRSAPGIGNQRVSAIRPEDRTTPAGRFKASLDHDLRGQEILWIDYASALALHRVAKGTPEERRAQRLESATSGDNRISYGCINVPVKFYEDVVSPAFTDTFGIVYILPEMGTAREVFGSYDVDVDA